MAKSARHNVPECFLSEISLFGARNWPAEIGGTLRQSLPPSQEDPNCTGDGSNVFLRFPDDSPTCVKPCSVSIPREIPSVLSSQRSKSMDFGNLAFGAQNVTV